MTYRRRDLKWFRQEFLPSLRLIWTERPAGEPRLTVDGRATAPALDAWCAPSLPVDRDAARDPAPV
jgi:hypothetical protein